MDYQLPPQTVEEGKLLVLGDNRNASLDSHLWGQLNEADVVGTPVGATGLWRISGQSRHQRWAESEICDAVKLLPGQQPRAECSIRNF